MLSPVGCLGSLAEEVLERQHATREASLRSNLYLARKAFAHFAYLTGVNMKHGTLLVANMFSVLLQILGCKILAWNWVMYEVQARMIMYGVLFL